ncbi:MAG: HAD-IB family hydrolase [Candidatus Kerfeldbacteria bacterium CG15_BIG_FIL_POST_REV_8_21_14_020_45_12]|uniref:HAD-IB family hydrolase n=1 Tax=Candidatus Kerfeldbacteria bacterium CG15_BIG_FIL_POST_REV_8_21_14_020_45_12 TaxID=2014247 RepID=A0A2M7H4U4_9BACT|nr:MAG: HAD-IB family hydrolase [Candidatus Kerfeldbacteria bacterium CG15_BIG_FIL_POST_REV_8_21_14_020_45_12]PJA93895.1 MAG: HAD-IB family hydrolase [Candidatus Kerfeldbacteria bacterium CG_4_9_14_3_um_filter_45_8]
MSTETTNENESNLPTLALFDFDGTISRRNSFLEFIAYTKGRPSLYFGLFTFIPTAVLRVTRQISADELKRRFFAKFCADSSAEDFHQSASDFGQDILPDFVQPEAAAAIRQHKNSGDTVVVVSASFQEVLKPWCDLMDVVCIATVMEIKHGIITGQLDTPICWGEQKTTRIKQALDLTAFGKIVAYGNSRGDKEMLALADEAFFKPFR